MTNLINVSQASHLRRTAVVDSPLLNSNVKTSKCCTVLMAELPGLLFSPCSPRGSAAGTSCRWICFLVAPTGAPGVIRVGAETLSSLSSQATLLNRCG